MQNSSLKLPSGSTGVVIDVEYLIGTEWEDERSIAIEEQIESVQEDKVEEEILNEILNLEL